MFEIPYAVKPCEREAFVAFFFKQLKKLIKVGLLEEIVEV